MCATRPAPARHPSATEQIVDALTQGIVTHAYKPGTKLAEQKLAQAFGVSRTLVRQALFQLSQQRLVNLTPARGACVASPSADEARQVFAVRHLLELQLVRTLAQQSRPDQLAALMAHQQAEQQAIAGGNTALRTRLLGDFHVLLARSLGNEVLAEILDTLISRCRLATLMFQTLQAAHDSSDEHRQIIQALAAGDETLAVQLMDAHLQHVQCALEVPRAPAHVLLAAAVSSEPTTPTTTTT